MCTVSRAVTRDGAPPFHDLTSERTPTKDMNTKHIKRVGVGALAIVAVMGGTKVVAGDDGDVIHACVQQGRHGPNRRHLQEQRDADGVEPAGSAGPAGCSGSVGG